MTISNYFRRKKALNKIVSVFIIQTFLFSNIAFAVPAKSNIDPIKKRNIAATPDSVIVPRDFGLVKSKFNGNSGKLIIHIQDAHCNYEAQSNIVKIVEGLIKNYSLGLVSVEGADGFIDTSWFKAFPDDEVRKEVADYFMKKGEITGPEFLSITTNLPFKLFGAETRSYYIQNLNAFTSSYPLKGETEKYFNSIKTVLNRLKGFIYSVELKALDAKVQDYESKKIQFNDYIRFLQTLAEHHKINLRAYENFFRLMSVLIYEKKIDFNVTDKERSALIDELSRTIDKDQLQQLVARSITFKSGKISSAEYYAYLKNLSAANGIDLSKKHPNLYNYIIYNAVYSKIENEKLFQDLKQIEIAVKEKLFQNDDQKTLEKLSRHIDILLGLINIKLMNGDFDYYEANKNEFSSQYFEDFLKKKAIQYGLAYDVTPPTDAVTQSIPKLEDFYSIAIKRDKALVDNTLAAMKKEKQQIAVLVTGGFHSEGIAKLLEKEGVSYMVVCPSITKDVPTPYIQILTNQRTPLEDILVGTAHAKEGMMAPPLRTWLVTVNESIARLVGGEGLVLSIRELKKGYIELVINGIEGAPTPVGKVNIAGYVKNLRRGTNASKADIVKDLRDKLNANLAHLNKLSREDKNSVIYQFEQVVGSEKFDSLVKQFSAEFNARIAMRTQDTSLRINKINDSIKELGNATYLAEWDKVIKNSAEKFPSSKVSINLFFDMGENERVYRYVIRIPPFAGLDDGAMGILKDYLAIKIYNILEAIGPARVYVEVDKNDAKALVKQVIDGFRNADGKLTSKQKPNAEVLTLWQRLSAINDRLERGNFGIYLMDGSNKNVMKQVKARANTWAENQSNLKLKRNEIKAGLNSAAKFAMEKTFVGIDVGGSDIKLVVIKDGKIVYIEKKGWDPKSFTKAEEYIKEIINRIKTASDKFRKIDRIGISWPDIVAGNRIIGFDTEKTEKLQGLEIDALSKMPETLAKEFKCTVDIANDGDVGAFFGAVVLGPNTWGLSLGTSVGFGAVTADGTIGDLRTYLGRAILDTRQLPNMAHNTTGVRGVVQQTLPSRISLIAMAKDDSELQESIGVQDTSNRTAWFEEFMKITAGEKGNPGQQKKALALFAKSGRALAEFVESYRDIFGSGNEVENIVLTGACVKNVEAREALVTATKYWLKEKGINVEVKVASGLNDNEVIKNNLQFSAGLGNFDLNTYGQALAAAWLSNQRTTEESRTPGMGAVRVSDFNAPYTEEEAGSIGRAIKDAVLAGKSREVFERSTGGVFVILNDYAYMQYAKQYGAPADLECHPGTKGTRIYYDQNRTIETYKTKVKRYYYIKESLFDKLTAKERFIFAMHEEMHIKVALGIEKCPEGMSEERFVNSQEECDVRPAMARLGSIAHMEDMLLTDTVYGDAAVAEIGRIKKEGTVQELAKFVNTTYQRRRNIDRMKSVLTEPYNGYDIIIISSSTEGEAREQQKGIGNAFEEVRTDNKILGNKVCVLSILDTSEGGQIIGQVNTWEKATEMDIMKNPVVAKAFKKWVEDARKNGVSVQSDDLRKLYNNKSVKVATYHNGGKAERFSPAGQALSLSRADQLLVGHVLDAHGRPIPLNLLLAVILSTSSNASSNAESRHDVYWANQIEFGTFADIVRSDFAFHKFAIALPPDPKMKDLFDYGTMIVDENGRIKKFLANKKLTKKNQDTGIYEPNPDYQPQLKELLEAAQKGRAYFDYGSFSMGHDMYDALSGYWSKTKNIFGVMSANNGKVGISRDIDPALVQILVPLVNGLEGKENELTSLSLPTAVQLDVAPDKDHMLKNAYDSLISIMDPNSEYRKAFVEIYDRAKNDIEKKEPDPSSMQALYETVEFFLRYRDIVFKDLTRIAGIIDFGKDSYWFPYKRLLDMANEKFFMLADLIVGDDMKLKTLELGPKGKDYREDAATEHRIRAEDSRRLRRIKNDAVCVFEAGGRKITLTADDVRGTGWKDEILDIEVKGSVIQGNCVLLPGSRIIDSVVNNSQGLIKATNSYVESTTAPVIDATNSIVIKAIDEKEILANKKIVADAYRPAIPGNHQTRMRADVDYDPKPAYNEIEDSVKVKDENYKDVKFTINTAGDVIAPNGKKVGVYTKRIKITAGAGNNITKNVYVEDKATKVFFETTGTLHEDKFEFISDHGLSQLVRDNLKKALVQGQYYTYRDSVQSIDKFATKPVSDYVQFGDNQYAFHEIREMPCDRADNDKKEHDLRIKVFIPMLASQQGASLSDRQRLDIWVNAYLSGVLIDLYNRSLYYEVFSNFGVTSIEQANQELSDRAVRTQLAYSKLIMNAVDYYTADNYAAEFKVAQNVALEEVPLIAANAVIERYAQKNSKIDGIAEKTKKAKDNLNEWMTKPQFADYHEVLKTLVMEAQTNDDIAKELFDSFYKTVPFGTGGRRGKVGIGPNRINPYMTALTTQGHCEYLIQKLFDRIKENTGAAGVSISDKDAMSKAREIMRHRGVVVAYDVREFKEYYPNTAAMQRYKEIIFEKCPVMVGFSSKKMAEIDGAVYAGNGFRYYMPSEVRSTPWLSFATANIHRILGDISGGEYYDDRALGGTVKSSSHNLPDNNGDKFYEEDGGQAPPKESQAMVDKGANAEKIVYYNNLTDIDEAIKQARKDKNLWVDLNEAEELRLIDEAYERVNIEELDDFVSRNSREGVKVAFNALNGTGDTCLLPILRSAGFTVIRSDGDVHDSTFSEAFEHRPNPEVEKTFDAVIRIAIKDDENTLKNFQLEPVVDSDNRGLTVNVPEDVNMDAVLREMRKLQISEITDPDADRLGLAIKKITIKDRTVTIKWLTANDNDESGIILFRYNIEKRLASLSKDKVYVFGTTVVSNEVEERIVKDLANKYGLNIVSLRHPVGFKFTGELMTNIKNKKPSGVIGRIMKTIPVNLNGRLPDCKNLAEAVEKGKAEFIMSFEEGEGGIIGSKGSVDKDSGIVGLAVAILAAEMAREDKTVYDYLQETYRAFNYGKSYLEPIVLDGTDGQSKINTVVKEFETNTPMAYDLLSGGNIRVKKVENYLKMGLQEPGVKTEEESLSMMLLTLEDIKLADGSIVKDVKILVRGSGTEPKIKIWVMVPAANADKLSDEAFEARQNLINNLNRDILDALLLKAYDMTDLSYNGYSVPQDASARLQLLRLDFNVALSKKLGNYFPMADKIRARADEIMAGKKDLEKSINELSNTATNTDLKALESAALVRESFRINLTYQLQNIIARGQAIAANDLERIAIQAMLLFDREEGLNMFNEVAKALNLQANAGLFESIEAKYSPAQNADTRTPGVGAVRTDIGNAAENVSRARSTMDRILASILNNYATGEDIVETMFKHIEESNYLGALAGVSNELNKKYAAMTVEERSAMWSTLERFYAAMSERALTVNDVEVAKGLQVIVGNTIALQNLIDNGVKGAENIQLTANLDEMLKAADAVRGPSYINVLSIPPEMAVAPREGAEGMYWRGAEVISKLGKNIIPEAVYAENKDKLDRLVMYTMLHVGKIHTTIFLHNRLPGSTQYISTGRGHFQSNKLDVKRVARGRMIQFADIYNIEGKRTEVTLQKVDEGEFAASIPGSVDYITPLDRITVFNDVSMEIKPWSILKFNSNLKAMVSGKTMDQVIADNLQTINGIIAGEKPQEASYLVINYNGKSALAQRSAAAPSINQIVPYENLYKRFKVTTFRQLVEELANIMSDTNRSLDFMNEFAKRPDEVKTENALMAMKQNNVKEYVRKLQILYADYIQPGRPFKVLPLIKTYPWGVGLTEAGNFILKNLGITGTAEEIAGLVAGKTRANISATDKIGESWLGKGVVAIETEVEGENGERTTKEEYLPVEVLSLFGQEVYGEKHVKEHKAVSGITAKILQAGSDLSWQIHSEFAEKITALEDTTVYVGLSETMTRDKFIKAVKEGRLGTLREKKILKGETLIVPANCPHAYQAKSVVVEFKDIDTDSPAKTDSFYDRGRLTSEERAIISEAVRKNHYDVDAAKKAIKTADAALYEKLFVGKPKTDTEPEVKPLIRPDKDGLTHSEAKLMDIAAKIENAGYLNAINPESLMLKEPILLTAKEAKNEARAEIIGITEGSVGLQYTIKSGQPPMPADQFSLGSGQPLTVLKGEIKVKSKDKKGEETVLKSGDQIIVPHNAGEYELEAQGEVEAVVVTSYKPLEAEMLVNTGFEAIRANIATVRSNKVHLLTTSKAFRKGDVRDPGTFAFERKILYNISSTNVELFEVRSRDAAELKAALQGLIKGEEKEGERKVNYVVQLTKKEFESIQNDKEAAEILKGVGMMVLPNELDESRGIPFIREIESAGVILGNTTEKDIEDKTAIAGWLRTIMSRLTGNSAIDWKTLTALVAPQKPNPAVFSERIRSLLLHLQVKIQPYKADEGVRERRQLLWSV